LLGREKNFTGSLFFGGGGGGSAIR